MNVLTNRANERISFLISIFCATIALFVRLMYFLKYPVPPRDAYKYELYIDNWNSGQINEISTPTPPLSLSILDIPHQILGIEVLKSGIVTNMLLGITIVLLLIKTAKLIAPSIISLLTVGITAALHPSLIHYSCVMLRENSYLLFSLLAIISTIKYIKARNEYYIFIIAFFCACSALCRHEALELSIYFMILIIFLNKPQISRTIKKICFFISSYVFVYLLILNHYYDPYKYIIQSAKHLVFFTSEI